MKLCVAPEVHAHDVTALPCSQSQKRFWFESVLHPDNPGLNVAVRWRLDGEVNDAHLEQAWQCIIERHETLRSSFTTIDGEPFQVIAPTLSFHVPVIDLTRMTQADADAEAELIAVREARRTFDLSVAPLIRVTHIRVRSDSSIVLVTAHHTVCDGWSIGVLAREMGAACADLSAGRAPALPELSATYSDYVAREQQDPPSRPGALNGAWTELRHKFEDFVPFEILPDKPRPPIQTANGDIVSALLGRELSDALAILARSNGATLFMTAYAALLVLLHRYSGQTDIAIGTQIAGREEVEYEPLVGTFINTIALRTDVSGDPRFDELLERARDTVTDAIELRDVSLEELVEIINPKRDLSRNALFAVNFVFQRSFIENASYGSFRLIDLPSKSAGPICDLNFFMVERPDGWRISCEFNADLYRRETVDRMLERFVRLLRAVVREPRSSISSLPILDETERRQLIALGSAVSTSYGRDETVHGLFAAQAARTPLAVAVAAKAGELTYQELDRRSNQLARYLRAAGVGAGTAVGVALERSIEIPVVLLGILKAGATYVPLDATYPRERIAFVIEDAGVRTIVTEPAVRDRLPNGTPLIDLAAAARSIAELADGACEPAGSADGRAYVMYTSGSTGRPKGVAIAHRAIARLVRETNYVDIRTDDTTLQYAPLAFDASTFEIWAPLLNGGRLAIAPPGVLSLAELDRTLDRFGVTTLWLTAALFREAVEGGLPAFRRLRYLLAGGDVISPLHAKRFIEEFPNCRLINGYGPTENTTFSCCYAVPAADAGSASLPIGRPISNSSAYVLDPRLQLVPSGVVGELCVGGDGLSAGYLNLPELTAERFVRDPFSTDPTARLYRTGDRVRQREDGVIEFLGRFDDQVKIRGYRIELRELEVVLSGHPDVADVVAIARDMPGGDKAIAAYVVPRGGALDRLDVAALRAWLGERLPAFMLPATIVPLPALVLSANGKVDLRALPAPAGRSSAAPETGSETEAGLAAILRDLLGIDTIDREADLFTLGLHSMLAIRFAARVQAETGIELQLRALFEQPTIAAIAGQIDKPRKGGRSIASKPIVTMNKNGARTPLIFFHGDLFTEGLYFRRLAVALGPDQPVHSVAPHGTAGLPLLPTIEAMASDYAQRIRSIQEHGPYRLGGYCSSGLIAYEVGRILQSAGESVERIVLLNSSPMPRKRIAALDWLLRRLGSDARLKPQLRDSLCYNLARIHAALVTGPRALQAALGLMLRSSAARSQAANPFEPLPFEERRGEQETENSFGHVVAALTYHAPAYDGDVSLIWGENQPTMLNDRTLGWGAVARSVKVVLMRGGHVGMLSGSAAELAAAFDIALGNAETAVVSDRKEAVRADR